MPVRDPIRRRFDTYIVERLAVIERGLRVPTDHTLVVGPGATIVGGIASQGRVHLGRDVVVRGDIASLGEVVLGAYARVEGDVESNTLVVVQEGAVVTGQIRCDGEVRIIGGQVFGAVESAGDITVRADATTRELKAGGRIRSLPDPGDGEDVRDS